MSAAMSTTPIQISRGHQVPYAIATERAYEVTKVVGSAAEKIDSLRARSGSAEGLSPQTSPSAASPVATIAGSNWRFNFTNTTTAPFTAQKKVRLPGRRENRRTNSSANETRMVAWRRIAVAPALSATHQTTWGARPPRADQRVGELRHEGDRGERQRRGDDGRGARDLPRSADRAPQRSRHDERAGDHLDQVQRREQCLEPTAEAEGQRPVDIDQGCSSEEQTADQGQVIAVGQCALPGQPPREVPGERDHQESRDREPGGRHDQLVPWQERVGLLDPSPRVEVGPEREQGSQRQEHPLEGRADHDRRKDARTAASCVSWTTH